MSDIHHVEVYLCCALLAVLLFAQGTEGIKNVINFAQSVLCYVMCLVSGNLVVLSVEKFRDAFRVGHSSKEEIKMCMKSTVKFHKCLCVFIHYTSSWLNCGTLPC